MNEKKCFVLFSDSPLCSVIVEKKEEIQKEIERFRLDEKTVQVFNDLTVEEANLFEEAVDRLRDMDSELGDVDFEIDLRECDLYIDDLLKDDELYQEYLEDGSALAEQYYTEIENQVEDELMKLYKKRIELKKGLKNGFTYLNTMIKTLGGKENE